MPWWWQAAFRHVVSQRVLSALPALASRCTMLRVHARRLLACVQVMGMLQGKVVRDTFIVIDSFALPVEGTETRVNAQVRG